MTSTSSICPPAESDELLNAVFDHAEKPEFVYRHVLRLMGRMVTKEK